MQLLEMFPDEKSSRQWFEDLRWPDGVRDCPHCAHVGTRQTPNAKPMPYWCPKCRQYFSVKTGTVMQSSKLPMRKWVFGIYLMLTSLKGVSSMKLHRDLGIAQSTAWHLAQRIRQGFTDDYSPPLSGEVEVDETYIGGKEMNKHASKKLNAGRGSVGKTAVAGAIEWGGHIKAQPVGDTSDKSLTGFVYRAVQPGSTVYTDDHRAYRGLGKFYQHNIVRHGAGEYVRGRATTNSIESFWAMFKRGYKGVYHKMSPKHLHRYVSEFAGRHNIRDLDTLQQMMLVALNTVGKRLRYKDLVAS